MTNENETPAILSMPPIWHSSELSRKDETVCLVWSAAVGKNCDKLAPSYDIFPPGVIRITD